MDWLKSRQDLLLILLVAFVIRFSFVGFLHTAGYTSDEKEYISLAAKLANNQAFLDSNGEWSTKAPIWPFVLSVLFRVLGDGLLVPHLLGCLLGTLVVYLGYLLCLELAGNRFVALIAAAVMALYPGLVIYADILQTETIYICFMLLVFLFLERMHRNPSVVNGVLLGTSAAGAAMTRAVFFGYFIVLLAAEIWLKRKQLRVFTPAIAGAAAVWCLLLLPWTIRNYEIHGVFVPVSSWGGISLMLGNNPYSTGTWSSKPGFDEWFSARAKENGIDLEHSTEIQRSELGKKLGLQFMAAEPVQAMRLAAKKLYMHWIYPITNSDSNTKLQAVAVAGDILVYAAAGIGLLMMGVRSPKLLPVLSAIVFFTLLQTVMHCEARYRLPIMPLIIVFSATGLSLLADTRKLKEFLDIPRNRVLAASWLFCVAGTYSFTAWQFLSGKI